MELVWGDLDYIIITQISTEDILHVVVRDIILLITPERSMIVT